jgi:hypothetical protein
LRSTISELGALEATRSQGKVVSVIKGLNMLCMKGILDLNIDFKAIDYVTVG